MKKRTFGLIVKEHEVGTDNLKNEIHLVVSKYDLSFKTELDHLEEGQAIASVYFCKIKKVTVAPRKILK